MSFAWLRRPRAIVLIAVALLGVAGLTAGLAAASTPGKSTASDVFTACLNTHDGTLNNVALNASHPKPCPANGVRVSWNQAGQVGQAGPAGAPGVRGATGAKGATGGPGPAGPSGAPGPAGSAAALAATQTVVSAQIVACGAAAASNDITCLHRPVAGPGLFGSVSATAYCPSGSLAMGGAITKTDTTPIQEGAAVTTTDAQFGSGAGWTGSVNNSTPDTHSYNVYALCITAPYVPVTIPTAITSMATPSQSPSTASNTPTAPSSSSVPTAPVTSTAPPSPSDTATDSPIQIVLNP